jgi:hypothetical protein
LEVLVEDTLLSVVVTNLADSPAAALVRDRGTRAFSSVSFSGRRDHGGFGDHGFRGRGRDLRDFAGDSFELGFYGFEYPITTRTTDCSLEKKLISRPPE